MVLVIAWLAFNAGFLLGAGWCAWRAQVKEAHRRENELWVRIAAELQRQRRGVYYDMTLEDRAKRRLAFYVDTVVVK